ncbi:MAG: PilZ domain-containing protein [Syntrophobacteraceae bacterium]|nr:PilZ domain-containing protein [Syntrophobacteraceae bacterium]
MCEEKRKFKRFRVKEGAFAAFVTPNELIHMGRIQDIGMGGLCLRYLSMDTGGGGDHSSIKIFGSNERFIHLDKVRCRVAYDCEVPEGTWEQISTRRCGVEFENLSVKDKVLLEDFIGSFGVMSNGQETSTAS